MPPSRRTEYTPDSKAKVSAPTSPTDEKPPAGPRGENVLKHGKRKASKIADDKLAYEDGKYYDMSLWKAIFMTLWRPWTASVMYNAFSRELRCDDWFRRILTVQKQHGFALPL